MIMRSLASVQEISGIKPIEGADLIEIAIIKGWQCVVKKGEFTPGDRCVYFEVDSYLPLDGRYEFLRKNSYRNNEWMGEGFRIKTITLRGQISQGLVLKLSEFPELEGMGAAIGADVTAALSVRKWEQPEYAGNMGITIGDKPHGIPTTDETRLQSMPEFIDAFRGKPYYITTKLDGTSCTVYVKGGAVGVCGRNDEYKEDPQTSSMWEWVYRTGLKDRLISLGEDIALQGEFCGAGIQKNRLKLKELSLFIFDIVKLDDGGKRAGLKEIQSLCEKLQIDMVPVEEAGDDFNYTVDELLQKASGKYASGLDKEGIVVRTQDMGSAAFKVTKEDGTTGDAVRRLSFKVINNDFLRKEEG